LKQIFVSRVYVCGGWHPTRGMLDVLECLNPVEGTWTNLPPMPSRCWGCAAAVLEGLLYVVGGDGKGMKALSCLRRYGPKAGEWESLKSMFTPRSRCAAVATGGQLIVVGGQVMGEALAVAERYHPGTDSWASLTPMPTRRSGCAAVALQGFVYVVGGHWDGQAMASVERFNPDDLVWERLSHMSSRRSHCGAAALGGRLWVVGGLDSMSRLRAGRGQEIVHSTVEVYDPEADQWDEYPEALPHQCWGSAVSAAGGRLYVVGGYADQQTTDVALCLKPRGNASNPQGSSWKVLAPMPTRRWGAGGVAA